MPTAITQRQPSVGSNAMATMAAATIPSEYPEYMIP